MWKTEKQNTYIDNDIITIHTKSIVFDNLFYLWKNKETNIEFFIQNFITIRKSLAAYGRIRSKWKIWRKNEMQNENVKQ